MRPVRHFRSSFLAIAFLIVLSVITVVSVGESFKVLAIRKGEINLRKRDGSTITFDLPWKSAAHDIADAKAISPDASGLLGAITNIAGALLNDGTNSVDHVVSEANPLTSKVLAAASGLTAALPTATVSHNLNNAVSQGDGIVNGLASDASGIVASILAIISGASNIGVLSILPTPTTTSEPQEFLPQSNLHSSSTTTSSQQQNITSAPSLNTTVSNPTATTGSLCPSPTTCTLCPPAQTETCTVTERWHMTQYEKTETLFSFADVYTVTCTETINICPSSSPSAIACANGAIVKRQEDCLLPNYTPNTSSTSDSIPSRTHPCPNAGYSCSECPDGYFCPPQQTPAQSCPCGYGWACAHCSEDWFCVPAPSSVDLGPINSVASLLGNVTLAPNPTSSVTPTAPHSSSTPNATSSITPTALVKTSAPNLSAIASALGLSMPSATSGTSPVSSIPNLSDAISAVSQVNSAVGSVVSGVTGGITGSNLINSVVGEVVSALGQVSGLSGDILAQVTAILASVNAAPGNVLPTPHASDLLNFPPRLIPLPTLAREVNTQPSDVVRQITTVTVVRSVRPVPANVPAAPGIVDGANGEGLKEKRQEARKDG